jgi:hypothetical protein
MSFKVFPLKRFASRKVALRTASQHLGKGSRRQSESGPNGAYVLGIDCLAGTNILDYEQGPRVLRASATRLPEYARIAERIPRLPYRAD